MNRELLQKLIRDCVLKTRTITARSKSHRWIRRYSGFGDSENGAEGDGREGEWKVNVSLSFLN